jgi:hypothetical protein
MTRIPVDLRKTPITFDIGITPEGLAITTENERGVLATCRLDLADQLIFEREDLPEAYIVFSIPDARYPRIKNLEVRGLKSGEIVDEYLWDVMSRQELNWITLGGDAMRMLRPPRAGWQFN